MNHLIALALLLLSLLYGLVCIRDPMKVAAAIVWWTKLVSHGIVMPPKAAEAMFLMEHDRTEYAKRFDYQLVTIQRTGWVALFVAVVGTCIVIFGR